MEIIHRLGLNWSKTQKEQLANLGITVNEGVDAFEISESAPSWPQINRMVSEWSPLDIVTTRFESSELESSACLIIRPDWHFGYPQPEGDFGYLGASYDLADYCSECGIGKKQCAPFRMKGEPKWGKRHILQLNWIFDEFFVQPEAWKEVFAPFGVKCVPVVNHRTGKDLETVVQLSVDSETASPIQLVDEPAFEVCPSCGRKKYLPFCRGRFPFVDIGTGIHMAKTREYFGSGASAWKAVVVTAELFRAVQKKKLRGASFWPVDALART